MLHALQLQQTASLQNSKESTIFKPRKAVQCAVELMTHPCKPECHPIINGGRLPQI